MGLLRLIVRSGSRINILLVGAVTAIGCLYDE